MPKLKASSSQPGEGLAISKVMGRDRDLNRSRQDNVQINFFSKTMTQLNQKLVHRIALEMAKSEGWMLESLDESNKHCQRYIQLATVAVEIFQKVEEDEWEARPWELEVSGLKEQQALWSDPPFVDDDGSYPECLLQHEY